MPQRRTLRTNITASRIAAPANRTHAIGYATSGFGQNDATAPSSHSVATAITIALVRFTFGECPPRAYALLRSRLQHHNAFIPAANPTGVVQPHA